MSSEGALRTEIGVRPLTFEEESRIPDSRNEKSFGAIDTAHSVSHEKRCAEIG